MLKILIHRILQCLHREY